MSKYNSIKTSLMSVITIITDLKLNEIECNGPSINIEAPTLLVFHHSARLRLRVRDILRFTAWNVLEAATEGTAIRVISEHGVSLVLMSIGTPIIDDIATIAPIRTRNIKTRSVPIIAVASQIRNDPERHARSLGMDGAITMPCSPSQLLATVESWRPSPHSGDALAATFGATRAAGLLDAFHDELAIALASLDARTPYRSIAHRVAGSAGILGFREIHATWLALSEGDVSALEPARRAARKVTATR
jgi:CheY-like chemotaxis protein